MLHELKYCTTRAPASEVDCPGPRGGSGGGGGGGGEAGGDGACGEGEGDGGEAGGSGGARMNVHVPIAPASQAHWCTSVPTG